MRAALCIACIVACGTVAVSAARSAFLAGSKSREARESYTKLAALATQLRTARHEADLPHAVDVDPQQAMVAHVSAALTRAGIPVSRMTSLSPGGAAPIAAALPLSDGTSAQRMRRSASITLDHVSLPDLGAFLSAWGESQPGWRVSTLQLTPIPLKPGELTTGKPLPGNALARPLTVHLSVESVSVERRSDR